VIWPARVTTRQLSRVECVISISAPPGPQLTGACRGNPYGPSCRLPPWRRSRPSLGRAQMGLMGLTCGFAIGHSAVASGCRPAHDGDEVAVGGPPSAPAPKSGAGPGRHPFPRGHHGVEPAAMAAAGCREAPADERIELSRGSRMRLRREEACGTS
jgi:hypothetical protein